MLEASGIRPDVIAARGYWTATAADAKEVDRLGHSANLVRDADALMLPVHDVWGTVAMTIIRPDVPKLDARGRPRRYQAPRGAKLTPDVPPMARPALGDATVSLWVTEGTKKADAAISNGAGCAVAFHGVWGWKKDALPALEYLALRDRTVYVAFDSDAATNPKVTLALRRLKAVLGARGAHVRIVHLAPAPDGGKVGLDDALAAGVTLEHLAATSTEHLTVPLPADDRRPALNVSPLHRGVVLEAFRHAATGGVYRTAAGLTVIRQAEGSPRAQLVNVADLRSVLDRLVRCTGTDGAVPVLPPRDLAEIMVHDLAPPVPPLRGILTAPTFTADGRYLDTPGYDAASGLFIALGSFRPPAVPARPTAADCTAARDLWHKEVLVDFPLATDADRAAALALALTPLVRNLIGGCVPLFTIDAAKAGAGKGLLATVCLLPTLGQAGWAVMALPRDDDEVRKRLLATLLSQPQAVVFDNVRGYVDSPVLNLALTATWFDERVLGVSRNARVPVRCAWAMTSNNVALADDTARRCVPIRLVPKTAHPELREDFRHWPLERWVLANRPDLFWALAVMVRHWQATGCPRPSVPPLGSFEEWTLIVGGILQAAGYKDFHANRDALIAQSDPDTTRWENFTAAWFKQHKNQPVTVTALLPLAEEHEVRMNGETDTARSASLGKALAARRDAFFGPLQLQQGTGRERRLWHVVEDPGDRS
jgi:hypothetical protein